MSTFRKLFILIFVGFILKTTTEVFANTISFTNSAGRVDASYSQPNHLTHYHVINNYTGCVLSANEGSGYGDHTCISGGITSNNYVGQGDPGVGHYHTYFYGAGLDLEHPAHVEYYEFYTVNWSKWPIYY